MNPKIVQKSRNNIHLKTFQEVSNFSGGLVTTFAELVTSFTSTDMITNEFHSHTHVL